MLVTYLTKLSLVLKIFHLLGKPLPWAKYQEDLGLLYNIQLKKLDLKAKSQPLVLIIFNLFLQ